MNDETKVILEVVGRFSHGALLEEIMLGLSPSLPRRTLQRKLASLVKEGEVVAFGKARARRYKLPTVSPKSEVAKSNIEPSDFLEDLLQKNPKGLSLEEILVRQKKPLPRRTLQRKLSQLVKAGQLISSGKGNAQIYKAAQDVDIRPPSPEISAPGRRVLAAILKPIQIRQSVGYHREFLESYEPNVTYYLPQQLRRKLFDLGKSYDGDYPAGTYARRVFERLLIDLSWNSSRLEGNSYSLIETERLLQLGKAAEGKDRSETQMILNHKAAIEFIAYSAQDIGINRYTIFNLHTLLSDGLMQNRSASGRLRAIPVGIGGSSYLPSNIPQIIEECFNLLIDKAKDIQDPFEQAFFLMVQLPYLQPFEDVNKRTSRLAANIPLIKENLCPLSFIDVPDQTYVQGLLGVYELNRIELLRDVFAWAYERSCALYSMKRKELGEPDPFEMNYRESIKQMAADVVLGQMDKTQAIEAIRKKAHQIIPQPDQARYIEIVERELLALHEGSIARFRLRPADYELWKKTWR